MLFTTHRSFACQHNQNTPSTSIKEPIFRNSTQQQNSQKTFPVSLEQTSFYSSIPKEIRNASSPRLPTEHTSKYIHHKQSSESCKCTQFLFCDILTSIRSVCKKQKSRACLSKHCCAWRSMYTAHTRQKPKTACEQQLCACNWICRTIRNSNFR